MTRVSTTLRFGMAVTAVGGFLDAYSYIGRGGVFAGAQSGNVVLLGVSIADADWHGAVVLLAPIGAFMAGAAVAAGVRHSAFTSELITQRVILMMEIALLVVAALVPDTAHDVPMSMLVSFAAALQVATFRKVRDWSFTTTITTNNLVTAVTSTIQAVSTDDRRAREQSTVFTCIVGSFLAGAIAGGGMTLHFGGQAALLAVAILALLLAWLCIGEQQGSSQP